MNIWKQKLAAYLHDPLKKFGGQDLRLWPAGPVGGRPQTSRRLSARRNRVNMPDVRTIGYAVNAD
jgi:hypothetical protein